MASFSINHKRGIRSEENSTRVRARISSIQLGEDSILGTQRVYELKPPLIGSPAKDDSAERTGSHKIARLNCARKRGGRQESSRSQSCEKAPAVNHGWHNNTNMPDFSSIEQKLLNLLGTSRHPVAVIYMEEPPAGVPLFAGSQPSSCSFWRLAAEGRSFYTVPSDHFNCPVGSYTHRTVTPEKMPELQQTLDLMASIGYIRMEEIPGVFQLSETPRFVVYTPLRKAPAEPSVVLAAGKPAKVMLLAEAATRAKAFSKLPMLGRPTCMAIPAALAEGTVTSAGCIGNRVYTEIGDDELYVVLRGRDLEAIAAEIDSIQSANQVLTGYHKERRETLTRL